MYSIRKLTITKFKFLLIFKNKYFATNPFITRKINYISRIFAKIQLRNYRFSGITNPQKLLRYMFSFPRYRENIGLKILLTVHIFEFLIMLFLRRLKSLFSGIWICLNFFHILLYLTSYLKNKYSFFNSAHNILEIFAQFFYKDFLGVLNTFYY